jgi:hypothetical protein
MHTLIVPGARGWLWLTAGFRLFRRNPPVLALLVVFYWVLMGLINVVPVIGPIAASICIPVFSVGIMNACRSIDRNSDAENARMAGFPYLFSAFRQNPGPLLALGGFYLMLTVLILGLSSIADGGTLWQLMMGESPKREALEDPGFLLAAQVALVLMTPVIMAYWYAPVLVAWHGFSPAKALFFSFFACLRNWRAFLAYSISLAVWGAILPGIVLGVLGGLISGAAFALALLSAPILLILAPTVFASFYVTYREVFATDESVDVLA